MTKRIGYLRVSTQDQNLDRQIDGLKGICDELQVEKLSATASHRPIFEGIIESLAAGDTFVVWDLDRAFRSTIDAITTADQLRERGIHFQIVTLNVDTSTPSGNLIYTMMAAFGEFERLNLIERTKQRMAAARRRGKVIGRPKALDDEKLALAFRLLKEGKTKTEVAALLNCHPRTISRANSRHRGIKDQTQTDL